MYQKSSGLTKFVILFCDMICIAISIFAADFIWHDVLRKISRGGANYTTLLVIFLVVYVVLFLFAKSIAGFYVRGFLLELWSVIKTNALLMFGVTMVLFFMKRATTYSRMVLGMFFVFNCLLMWLGHVLIKKLIPHVYKAMVTKHNAIIVGSREFIRDIVEEGYITKDFSKDIVGKTLIYDEDEKSGDSEHNASDLSDGIYKVVDNIPEISKVEELTTFCKGASVDEVIIEIKGSTRTMLMPIIDELASAGIVIKYRSKLPKLSAVPCQAVGKAGDYFVATYASGAVSNGNLMLKRAFDIFAGAVGSLITIILTIFIAPAIKIESKGPVFFRQERIGRNGRRFTIFKFRSMYNDAEERKADLMKQNEMGDKMFKMEDDPRITKVGKFLRKTSLDEFPQFFNVFWGDMSLVGTRPPTVDEFEKYNLNHKIRLSFKPGLTGLWQVSGRNAVKDFDDVVALDMEYIRNWSPLLDIKIMFKTIPAMFSGE